MITLGTGFTSWVLIPLSVLICLLVVLAAVARSVRTVRSRRRRLRQERVRPYLFELIDGEHPDDLDPSGMRALDVLALDLLPQLRGADRENLRGFLADRGLVHRARRQLFSRRSAVRAEAAEMLGSAGDPGSAPMIRELLLDRDPRVRICAARALGRLGDAASTGDLLTSVTHPTRPVPSGVAAMAVLRSGVASAPALRDRLAGPDPVLRALCAELLGHLGDLDAVPDLIAMLAHEADPQVVAAAARAAGRIGSPQASVALLHALGTVPWPDARAAAVWSLGAIGDPVAVEGLAQALHDDEQGVAAAAAGVLADLDPQRLAEVDCCLNARMLAAAALSGASVLTPALVGGSA